MSKRTIGTLTIVSLLLALTGAGLIIAGIVGGPGTTVAGNAPPTGFAHMLLFIVGVVLASLALILHLLAYAGALIALARLQQWGWFVSVMIAHGIAVLLYLIAGPTTPATDTVHMH